ncbi:DUF424 family protein [Candidatus Woesearchaeota archaeon]|nr:DUF424 family protein [Candidatus Woesearchaeota archaeon]
MIAKIHKNPEGQIILALCDKGLLGKKFVEKELQLDLTGDFYKGEEKTKEEVEDMLNNAYIVNAVGEKCIAFLLEKKLIEKEHVITICGVPHAQCVIVRE